MPLQLIYVTLFTILFLLPLGYYLENREIQKKYFIAIYGAMIWAISLVLQFSIYQVTRFFWNDFIISIEYSRTSTIHVVNNLQGVLFLILVITSLSNEILRFIGVKRFIGFEAPLSTYAIFGLGWGVVEYLTRFLLFTDPLDLLFQTVLLLFLIVQNIILSLLILRTKESDKFIIFSFFIKFFTEMGLFGGIGFEHSNIDFLLEVVSMLLISVIIVYLSLLVRDQSKYQSKKKDRSVSSN